MDDHKREEYYRRYDVKKERSGLKFFPDIILKDAIVSLGIFLLLIGIVVFIGVPTEPPADPADTTYIPRPEWYFLFFFELLKFFPGKIEWVGTFILPILVISVLFLLPWLDKSSFRHPGKRLVTITVTTIGVLLIVAMTIRAAITTPAEPPTIGLSLVDKIRAGEELYSVQCVECHGAEGEGGEVKGVKGLEGVILKPIHSSDVMYTRTDETLAQVIDYGQPSLGMPGFGLANGGKLAGQEIDAIVAFMRYTWDDRMEMPKEAALTAPTLQPGEIPDFQTHVYPIIKRNCISCHREGRAQQNYVMTDYNQIIKSGDHAPNVIPGNPDGSNLIQMVLRKKIAAGGPMPPSRPLKKEEVDILIRWVKAGAEALRTGSGLEGLNGTATITGTTTIKKKVAPKATP